jgi:predicted GNAT superfamily acetyltransferase
MVATRGSREAGAERSVVVEIGGAAGEAFPVVVRPLRSLDDYRACESLERQTWGEGFSECVPGSILMISQKVGGVAAGAFDSDGRMIGMVFGLTGPRRGELAHWSHMLAVRPDYRGLGLGRELKLYQRRVLRERGVRVMLWTFDPLVARNAHLNICRLGARPIEYVRDLYGADTSSELHSGLGTDRFVVEWRLDEEEAIAWPDDAADWASTPIVNVDPGGDPLADPERLSGSPVRVEIPADIQAEKALGADRGALWRRSTRRALEAALSAGLAVHGFERDAAGERCRYRLAPGHPA